MKTLSWKAAIILLFGLACFGIGQQSKPNKSGKCPQGTLPTVSTTGARICVEPEDAAAPSPRADALGSGLLLTGGSKLRGGNATLVYTGMVIEAPECPSHSIKDWGHSVTTLSYYDNDGREHRYEICTREYTKAQVKMLKQLGVKMRFTIREKQ